VTAHIPWFRQAVRSGIVRGRRPRLQQSILRGLRQGSTDWKNSISRSAIAATIPFSTSQMTLVTEWPADRLADLDQQPADRPARERRERQPVKAETAARRSAVAALGDTR